MSRLTVFAKDVLLKAVVSFCASDEKSSIVVSGSPRSGTTWLSELCREIPGYRLLDEPLNLKGSPLAQRIPDLEWRTHIGEQDKAVDLRDDLHRALTGRVPHPYMWQFEAETRVGRFHELVSNRNTVVKIIRISRMLPWFSRTFSLRSLISIYRHPCAVVSSQLRHRESWNDVDASISTDLRQAYGKSLPESILSRFQPVLQSVNSAAGRLAAVWALDTFMSLQGPVYGPWIALAYEDLVSDPREQMQRIFEHLGEPIPDGITERFETPSSSAARDLRVEDTKAQLSKWQNHLTEAQIASVLDVVEGFGLDELYSDSIYPDTSALQARVDAARASS